MKTLLIQFFYMLEHRMFLALLLIVNLLGTIYGYIWYISQLSITDPQFYIFVPDSPTASLFFTFAILGWLLNTHFKLIEALALITLVKYGIWAVVMNILTLIETGSIGMAGWMLITSHFLMAVQALLYLKKYKFTLIHIVLAGLWTLHNDVIDYVYGQMPIYHSISKYSSHIGYFTFWLSVSCIFIAVYAYKQRICLQKKG